MKIDFQISGKHTLLGIDGTLPQNWLGDNVIIKGKKYSCIPVYDMPNHIAIIGSGDFIGEEIEFI